MSEQVQTSNSIRQIVSERYAPVCSCGFEAAFWSLKGHVRLTTPAWCARSCAVLRAALNVRLCRSPTCTLVITDDGCARTALHKGMQHGECHSESALHGADRGLCWIRALGVH